MTQLRVYEALQHFVECMAFYEPYLLKRVFQFFSLKIIVESLVFFEFEVLRHLFGGVRPILWSVYHGCVWLTGSLGVLFLTPSALAVRAINVVRTDRLTALSWFYGLWCLACPRWLVHFLTTGTLSC